MSNCYLCCCQITEDNKSAEHIVSNALGGNKKSYDLLCRKCNNATGVLEDELCKPLMFFISALKVRRERGKIPNFSASTGSGKKVYIKSGFQVSKTTEFKKINESEFILSAPDIEAARKNLVKLKERYPNIDIEKILADAQEKDEYLDDVIHFSCTLNDQAQRAIAKIILNYALYEKIEINNMKEYVDYINGIGNNNFLEMYNGRTPYFFNDDIISVVSIIGSQKEGKIIGYLQLFNIYKFYIVLNDCYQGEDFNSPYFFFTDGCIDDILTNIKVFEEDICVIWNTDNLKRDINKVIRKIRERQIENERNRIISKVFEKMKIKFPQEEYPYFTKEMINYLSNEVAVGLTKFMIHLRGKRNSTLR